MAGSGEYSGACDYVTIEPDEVGTTLEEQQNILQEIQGRNLPDNSSQEDFKLSKECQARWDQYREPAVVHHRVTKLPRNYVAEEDFPAEEDSKSWIATMVKSNVKNPYWMVSLAVTLYLAATWNLALLLRLEINPSGIAAQTIPASWANEHMLAEDCIITLRDKYDQCWDCNYKA
jgi:hypothetical protein